MANRRTHITSLSRRIWHDRHFRFTRWGFVLLTAIALLGDFIANDEPLYCKLDGTHQFPAFREAGAWLGLASWSLEEDVREWRNLEYQFVVFAPVPYSATESDLRNANFRSPFGGQEVRSLRFRHWLGTDHLGRDVAAGLVYGARVALFVGLFSMFIAACLGIPIGAMAGFLGDRDYSIRLPQFIVSVIGSLCALYFLVLAFLTEGNGSIRSVGLAGITLILMLGIRAVVSRTWSSPPRFILPVDSIVLRSIEIIRSIPAFFLLFAILGMIRTPRLGYVIGLIGILWCPSIIRFVRAEALKLREQTFVQSARVLGLSQRQITWRHVIPNAMGPALITIAFGMGSAVLIESGLSFLGIGVAPEVVTWGKMLNLARSSISAWWIALLPGVAIFITIAIFIRLGDVLESQISGHYD